MQSDFAFTQHLVDNILYYCIYDPFFLRMTRNILDVEILPGEIVQELLKLCYRFFDESGSKLAPGDSFTQELEAGIKLGTVKKELGDGCRRVYESLKEFNPADKNYILRQVDKFSRKRYYEKLAVEIGQKARRMDLEGTKDLLKEATRFGVDSVDFGLDFFSEEEVRRRGVRYETKEDFLMPFGIEPFDKKGGHLQRKFFVLIMAPEKRGKTWGGVHFGRVGLMQGLNVLHITHGDVTANQMSERYEMSLAGVGASFKEKDWEHKTPVVKDGKVHFKDVKPGTVKDRELVEVHTKALRAYGGKLMIREFPRGTCSMRRLEKYIDSLEVGLGFVPDVIINDYPDIMMLPKVGDYRHQVNRIYEEHARLSHERNCLVIGFSQVSKGAYTKKYITMADFAEDKRKAAHCDAAFAICRTMGEEEKGMARLVWVLDRHYGLDKTVAMMVQDYHIGQFCKKAYSLKDLDLGDDEQEE